MCDFFCSLCKYFLLSQAQDLDSRKHLLDFFPPRLPLCKFLFSSFFFCAGNIFGNDPTTPRNIMVCPYYAQVFHTHENVFLNRQLLEQYLNHSIFLKPRAFKFLTSTMILAAGSLLVMLQTIDSIPSTTCSAEL